MGKYKKGLTLVETILYASIITVIFLVVINSLLTVVRVYKETAPTRNINISGSLAMDRILRDIRNSADIDEANSLIGINPGKLVLLSGPTTTEFYVENGLIFVEENSLNGGSLIHKSVTTTDLTFTLVPTPNSTGVRVKLTLESGSGSTTKTSSFYGMSILRNSY